MQTRQEEKPLNSNRHYSLRKLSVGLASVLIGISFLNGTKTTVKADTIANNNDGYAEAHENNESSESIQDALLKNTGVAEGDSVHMQSATSVDMAGILANTSPVQSSSSTQNSSEMSTKAGEVSKAGNFKVAGDISSAQNSVAGQSQKNLLDDLGKQKTSTQSGDQAEAQENRLVDEINYKLSNNSSTDNKEDLGQNKVASDETKQTPTTKSDAEKSIVQPSSTQETDNQSSNHAENNSQTQPQNTQKLDITKNSKKLDEKALATNLTQDNSSQKDYTSDISAWTGHDDGTYYILDKYTPQNDTEKDLIVIPNEADFEKAGKSTNGHEVGIKSDAIHTAMKTYNPKKIHFSETDNKKIKAIDPDWHSVFRVADDSGINSTLSRLEAITGNSLDTKNINDMRWLCYNDKKLTNISALSTWDVSNVSNMTAIFQDTDISDLAPLTNWNTKSLFYIGHGFSYLPHLTSIEPLQKWNMQNTRLTDNMFTQDPELVNINAINAS